MPSPRSALVRGLVLAVMVLSNARADQAGASTEANRLLRHVVLLAFKDSSSPADVRRIVSAFRDLPEKIEVIEGFEWGTDVSPEGRSQGFTHCFVVTFTSEAARDAYLPHPAHQEFVSLVRPHIDKVCVVDFWAQPAR